jgi:putative DNA primase/helicase
MCSSVVTERTTAKGSGSAPRRHDDHGGATRAPKERGVSDPIPFDPARKRQKKERVKAQPPEPFGDWRDTLHFDDRRKITAGVANVVTILANDQKWIDVVARNEFSAADASFMRAPPWDEEYAPRTMPSVGDPWADADDTRGATWLARWWSLNVRPGTVAEGIKVVAAKNAFHPVRDYFDGLEHDGTPRLGTWLTIYAGAEANGYSSAVGTWWMVSAVARVYRPGCKADHVLTLEGNQGLGKSSLLKVLASEDWFTDELGDLGNKDTAMQLQGRLIVEAAELDALSRADISRQKAFITRSSDKFRPPWGRRTITVPRQCVFAATTNKSAYLKDETGNRRFWPVLCKRIDLDAIARDRDQLWAEAVAAYRDGKEWWPTTADDHKELAEQVEHRRQPDPWEAPIREWLEERLVGSYVTTAEVLTDCLSKKKSDWTRADEMRVAECMKALSWERERPTGENGKRLRAWKKVSQ